MGETAMGIGVETRAVELVCKQCGVGFLTSHKRRKFCTVKCQKEFFNNGMSSGMKALGVSTATVGAIQELTVAVDLLRRGLPVFRALSPSCPCDLAILDGDKLIRVEVATGTASLTSANNHIKMRTDRHKFDILAVVVHSGKIMYSTEPPRKNGVPDVC